jgi:hypothetical protein
MLGREQGQFEVINGRKGDWPLAMDYRSFAEWKGAYKLWKVENRPQPEVEGFDVG